MYLHIISSYSIFRPRFGSWSIFLPQRKIKKETKDYEYNKKLESMNMRPLSPFVGQQITKNNVTLVLYQCKNYLHRRCRFWKNKIGIIISTWKKVGIKTVSTNCKMLIKGKEMIVFVKNLLFLLNQNKSTNPNSFLVYILITHSEKTKDPFRRNFSSKRTFCFNVKRYFFPFKMISW